MTQFVGHDHFEEKPAPGNSTFTLLVLSSAAVCLSDNG